MDVAQLRGADQSCLSPDPAVGYPAVEVAAALNRDPATMSTMLTRLASRLPEDTATQRELDRLAKKVKI